MGYVKHTFSPVFDANSKVLILGTFPSVKSREGEFYYHHPRNRFWKVIAGITNRTVPNTIEEKKILLLNNNIAIWDVIDSCDIEGSSDSSIRNVIPSDLSKVLNHTNIKRIFANGDKAYRLYMKYCFENTGLMIHKLPSTSPANAAYRLEQLIEEWSIITRDLAD